MIHEIARELQTAIRAKECPIPVFGRDKKTPAGWTPERIVIEHDLQGSDTFAGPRSQHENPKHSFTRGIAAKATIYAKSPAQGAAEFEHRRRVEKILDVVLSGMRQVSADRRNTFTPKSGSFVVPADIEASDVHGGAAYALKFSFDRAVKDTKFDGTARPEATLARVSMAGAPTLTFAEVGATGDTVTRSAGSWIVDGFSVGMRVSVRGTTSNNVSGALIAAVSATVLTLDTTDLTAEGPVSGCKVVAGGFRNSAFVSLAGGVDDDGDYTTVPAAAELVWEQQ